MLLVAHTRGDAARRSIPGWFMTRGCSSGESQSQKQRESEMHILRRHSLRNLALADINDVQHLPRTLFRSERGKHFDSCASKALRAWNLFALFVLRADAATSLFWFCMHNERWHPRSAFNEIKISYDLVVVEIFASLDKRVSFFGRGENSLGDHCSIWKSVGRKLLKVLMHY